MAELNSIKVKIMICLTAALIWGSAFGQNKLLKKADGLFFEKKYTEAYAIYDKVYDKNPKREILLKMAECNYNTESYTTAQNYYAEFFKDSITISPLTDYENYAKTCKITGKINLAANAFAKIYQADQNNMSAKYNSEVCQMFLDSSNSIKVFNLDSNYNCITVDASESVDSAAAPHIYIWDMGDGSLIEGITVNYCYKNEGTYKIALSIRDRSNGNLRYNDTSLSVKINHSILNFNSPKRAKPYFVTDFYVSDSTIANCKILEYFWQMGDGIIHCDRKIKHKYSQANIYYVRLTVIAKNAEGNLRLFSSSRAIEIGTSLVPFKESSIYHLDNEK